MYIPNLAGLNSTVTLSDNLRPAGLYKEVQLHKYPIENFRAWRYFDFIEPINKNFVSGRRIRKNVECRMLGCKFRRQFDYKKDGHPVELGIR